ncbi:hypothetical protein LEMLEM_LOCUS8941 [Lemmus lemmus]
MLKGPSPVM